jgi:EAL domain-containing protein (putative c-di-GMP-specific phosphodiesterase class I)
MGVYDKSNLYLDKITLKLIKSIINNKNYSTQYQPIVDIQTDKIIAYEAYALFQYNKQILPTGEVFQKCHDNSELFFMLERELKYVQFKNRIDEKPLFINFDPHIFLYKEGVNNIFEFFKKQHNFVFQLVENSYTKVNIKKLIKLFQEHQYNIAIDSFFKENSVVSMYLLNHSQYVKLDKDILEELRNNSFFYHIVDGIIKFAHNMNKQVILEGIESKDDLEIAKRRGIDLVQGIFYKNDFIVKK